MATNEFLPFATAGGANVQTQAEYAAEPSRLAGVVAGRAKSSLANKSWRQSASMAAMLGAYLANNNHDALDDGDVDALLDGFTASVRALAANRLVATGTASALTVTLDPVPASYAELNVLWVQLASTITGATTINVNGLGAKNVLRGDGTALKAGDGVVGQVLMLLRNGDDWQVAGLSSVSLPPRNIVRYTTAGTYTFVVPAGVYLVYVEVQGGGAGGGGATASTGSGGGGGGGGYAEGWVAVTPGQSITVIVGAGGTAGNGATPTNGGAGGTSSFGSTAPVSATGGAGGTTQSGGGGAGGSGSGGQINQPGGVGYGGTYINGTSTPVGGNGAPSYRGPVIPALVSGTSVNGFGPGVGGSGSAYTGSATNGGTGQPGQVTIRY